MIDITLLPLFFTFYFEMHLFSSKTLQSTPTGLQGLVAIFTHTSRSIGLNDLEGSLLICRFPTLDIY